VPRRAANRLTALRKYLQQASAAIRRFRSAADLARMLRAWLDDFPGTRPDEAARWAMEAGPRLTASSEASPRGAAAVRSLIHWATVLRIWRRRSSKAS
jgi:hypothetical protein